MDLADGALTRIVTPEMQRAEPCYKSSSWCSWNPTIHHTEAASKAGCRAKEDAWQFLPPRKASIKIHNIIPAKYIKHN